jgi:hypothetical protein
VGLFQILEEVMSDLNAVYLPKIVTDRWAEAMVKNDMATWRSCAYMAGLLADDVENAEPNNVLVPALRGIADRAHANYMAMMPKLEVV